MTVKEFIERLQLLNPELNVCICVTEDDTLEELKIETLTESCEDPTPIGYIISVDND